MNKGQFLPRRHHDNPILREYEQAVERGRNLFITGYHVVHHANGWAVKRFGAERGHVFDTQAEAIHAAKRTAQREGTELFIHGRDGRIRERNSYSKDPSLRQG